MFGGGDRGNFLEIGCEPDSALKTAIDNAVAAGTSVQGTLVKLSGAAYTVTGVAEGDTPDGKIMNYEKSSGGYKLQVRLWHCKNSLNAEFCPRAIFNAPYTGTISVGNAVVASATSKAVKAATLTGCGYVIAKDVPAGYCDVII